MRQDLQTIDYRLGCLRSEIDHLTGPRQLERFFLKRHLLQFYWTVTRLFGRSDLHDGRALPPRRKALVIDLAATAEGAACGLLPDRPRLLIDVSTMVSVEKQFGIQVVVREFAAACYRAGIGHPVCIDAGKVYSALDADPASEELSLRRGDCLFLLDPSWVRIGDIEPLMARIKLVGGSTAACLYDLIPLLYPDLCAAAFVAAFQAWYDRILPACDAILCISQAVADDLRARLRTQPNAKFDGVPIAAFELGVRATLRSDGTPSEKVTRICDPRRTFLSVGTIEPRKGLPVALDAFDRLWAEGVDVTYLIVGRSGWNMGFFEARIREHPLFGERLFWLSDADDAELTHAYANCRALVSPSIAEGFGLPLVEAASYGLPLILSDIAIFREVAGDAAYYVPVCDPAALATAIRSVAEEPADASRRLTKSYSWDASVRQVAQLVRQHCNASPVSRPAPR